MGRRGMRWSASQEKSPFHDARATVPQCLSPPGAAHKRALVRTACSLAASLTPGSPRCTFSPMLPCYVISLWLSEISFFIFFFFLAFWLQAAIYSQRWSHSVLVKSQAAFLALQVGFQALPETSRFFSKQTLGSGLKIGDCPIFYLS